MNTCEHELQCILYFIQLKQPCFSGTPLSLSLSVSLCLSLSLSVSVSVSVSVSLSLSLSLSLSVSLAQMPFMELLFPVSQAGN